MKSIPPRARIFAVVAVLLIALWYSVNAERQRTRSVLSGYFETQPTIVASRTSGRVVQIVAVEGESVKAGQILVQLDASPAQADYEAKAATSHQLYQVWLEAKDGARPEDIAKAEAALAQQQAALLEAVNGPRPQDIAAGRAALSQANASVVAAQAQVQSALHGVQSSQSVAFGSNAAAAGAKSQEQGAIAAVTKASADLDAARQGAIAAQSAVDGAKAALDKAQNQWQSAQLAVSQAKSSVTSAEAALTQAQAASDRDSAQAIRETKLFEGGAASAQLRDEAIATARSSVAQVQVAQSALDSARTQATRSLADAAADQAAVTQAQAGLDQARAQVAQLQAQVKSAGASLAQITATRFTAEHTRTQAGATLQRDVTGIDVARDALATAQANLAGSEAAAQSASAKLDELLAGTRPEEIAQSRAAVGQAQAALDELRNGTRKEEVDADYAAAQAAASAAREAQLNVQEATVRAPRSGVLQAVPIGVGDLISTGTELMVIDDPTDIWLRVYVPESNLAGIGPGTTASVRVDGALGEVPAVVESVATTGEFTPANLQSPEERGKQVFGVKLRLAHVDQRVRPGCLATVTRIGTWSP